MKEKILVVAAHPDDDLLGCGGTLKNYTKQKIDVNVVYFTDGVSSRKYTNKKDQLKRKLDSDIAAKIIGYKSVSYFNLKDQRLEEYPILELIQKLEKIIMRIKPSIIFTHFHNDLNIDHQIVNKTVLTATRPNQNYTCKKILFFEVLSSTEWNFSNGSNFDPNYFVNIEKTIDFKIKAFKKYTKEIRKYPHPRSIEGIKTLAKIRGMQVGLNYSEAFMVGRLIS